MARLPGVRTAAPGAATFVAGQRVTYRGSIYGDGKPLTGTVVRMGNSPRSVKVRNDSCGRIEAVPVGRILATE